MLEHDRIALVIICGDLDYYSLLLESPISVKDSVRNHHHISFIFFPFDLLYLLLLALMHILQHF
jgi:hypothetical protein